MAQIRFSFIELIYTRLEQIKFLQEKLREDEGPSHHQEAVQPTCTRWIEGAAVLNCPSPSGGLRRLCVTVGTSVNSG